MQFIALTTSKQKLTAEIVGEDVRDIKGDQNAGIGYQGYYWTLGGLDSIVLFEAPDEKAAMDMASKRAGWMETEILDTVPGDPSSPFGPS